MTKSRAEEILNNAKGKSIAVVGDVMLDKYFWGTVSRISPEAPVPVIDFQRESYHLGGAANVACNLKSLDVEPLLFGLVGKDTSGNQFYSIADEYGINTNGIYIDSIRPTTVKTRIIGNNQQIARLDREVRDIISSNGENFILNALNHSNNLSAIILEDYNKGCLSFDLISKIILFAKTNDIPVLVDPKYDNFFAYRGITLLKPNLKEASKALGIELKTDDDFLKAGHLILNKLESENILLTLGAGGMLLLESNGNISKIPTRARHVADVSGAGDTAIATLGVALSGLATIKEASIIANYAAGVVCEVPGTVSIQKDGLLKAIEMNSNN